ncbi:UDP-N-acetylmuramoyl-L-alanyl-D-glutamate--2,6-diaminopimelate ligase, partial [Yersinia pestis PY-02]
MGARRPGAGATGNDIR